jgi:hypothetical protein
VKREIMLQIRCTGKVQKQLGIKPAQLSDIKEADSTLGNWFLNLFTIDRRKTFLFVNENTLLSFILFGVKKSNTIHFHEIFLKAMNQLLLFEGINAAKISEINDEYLDLEYTKTNSKKILGNMNDLMDNYKYSIQYEGGYKYCDLENIIRKMNRMPQRNLGWKYSIDAAKDLLK